MRDHIKSFISSRVFELSITLIILLNAALVGIELSTDNIVIKFIQLFIIFVKYLKLKMKLMLLLMNFLII